MADLKNGLIYIGRHRNSIRLRRLYIVKTLKFKALRFHGISSLRPSKSASFNHSVGIIIASKTGLLFKNVVIHDISVAATILPIVVGESVLRVSRVIGEKFLRGRFTIICNRRS